MTTKNMHDVVRTRIDRRSLLKRAGALGVSVPVAGTLFSACLIGDDDSEAQATGTETQDGSATGTDQSSSSASNSGSQMDSEVSNEVTVSAFDIGYDPDSVTVKADKKITLTFVNTGELEHDIEITGATSPDFKVVSQPDGLSSRAQDLLKAHLADGTPYAAAGPGQQMMIEFTPQHAGDYTMQCLVPGHADAGMRGPFNVVLQGPVANQDNQPDQAGEPTTTPMAPVDVAQLPNPEVAAPVGDRETQTVTYEIEIKELTAQIDEGIAYEFWTFDGTIPGTMLRCRVGDTVELTLKNPETSKLTHNIDLHGATGPGGGAKATTVAPGESATIRFKTLNPGAFVYHCAVAPIAHHISSGMYGLFVVEPEGGFPPVDREFYVMQNDLYLNAKRGEPGLHSFSMDKMYDERPDYVMFNGSVGSITGERAFQVNVGETVRIFFGVGGPNLKSSFHLIGEIFDRVMQESASEWSTNVQTTLVPAGGATVVEFTADVPGDYIMVDHSLGRMDKGALGIITVSGDPNPDIFEVISSPSQ